MQGASVFGWACALMLFCSVDASAQVRLPFEGVDGCRRIDPGDKPSHDVVNGYIDRCLDSLYEEMDRHERRGNQLAGVSAAGGLGVIASGLTSQAAGTMNAWVGVGLAPAIFDEVQQRRRINTLRRDTVSLLEQLQCRATYLDERSGQLLDDRLRLRRQSQALSDEAEIVLQRAGLVETAPLRLIALEARRIALQARTLSERMDDLPERATVTNLEAVVYNNIIGERQDLLSAGRASPFDTFRAVLAAPFGAAATFVRGNQSGAPPSYTSHVARPEGGLTVNYVIDFPDSASATPLVWAPQQPPPPAAAVTGADHALAASLQQNTRALTELGHGADLMFRRFVEVAERGEITCPRRRVIATPPAPPPTATKASR